MAKQGQEEALRTTNSAELGLLPHEGEFVLAALDRAEKAKNEANKEYAEAVDNSGGDWAFDDKASAVSAEWAHQREQAAKALSALLPRVTREPRPYPDPESAQAQVGSRVRLMIGGYEDFYDITSCRIPGMPAEEGIELMNPDSPLGEAVIGHEEGDEISWSGTEGREFSGLITGIDQKAQQLFYSQDAEG